MKFDTFSEYLSRMEGTAGRLELAAQLSELLRGLTPSETPAALYMVQGQLLPPFAGEPMGMAARLLLRAMERALGDQGEKGRSRDLDALLAEVGDPGLLAERLKMGREHGHLDLSGIYESLLEISRLSGSGSQDEKISRLANLFQGVSPLSSRYLARFVMGRLRLGIGDSTIVDALARTLLFSPAEDEKAWKTEMKRVRQRVEGAYNLCSDLGRVGEVLRREGLEGLRSIRPSVGYPIRMALCERLGSGAEIIEKLGRAAVESKYDGFRCQIHCDGSHVRIFSRNLEETTGMFPELVSEARTILGRRTAIFEGEALGYDGENDSYHPFQVTITRKRKHNILEKSEEIPLKCLVFDLLYLDGETIMERPFSERRRLLEGIFPVHRPKFSEREVPPDHVFGASRMIETDDPHTIDLFFDEVVEEGFEGIIAKRLDGVYTAGSRNFNWIKLKRSYKGALSDTVDLVLIGYYRGKGLRTRLGIGAVLGAVFDPETGRYLSIARIGSGLTEEKWKELREMLEDLRVPEPPPTVRSGLVPDFWVYPKIVVAVLADELTRSPVHLAGRSEGEEEGYALRFPRMVSGPRADKGPEEATTVSEIRRLFELQRQRSLRE
ncbi:MAG: ATP-dependent DNA ligase [Nitrospiraceae bacterium]|nr:ATP-dependent DNA ligase [Nitrospiraceae bacterium]